MPGGNDVYLFNPVGSVISDYLNPIIWLLKIVYRKDELQAKVKANFKSSGL